MMHGCLIIGPFYDRLVHGRKIDDIVSTLGWNESSENYVLFCNP